MAARPTWILASPKWSDAATLTASHEQAQTPASNLQRIQPTDIWSTLNLTPHLKLDFGDAPTYEAGNLVALLFTNASRRDTWRVRTAATEGALTSAPVFDSGRCLRMSGAAFLEHQDASFGVPTFTLEGRFRIHELGTPASIVWREGTGGETLSLDIREDGEVGYTIDGVDYQTGVYVRPMQAVTVTFSGTSSRYTVYVNGEWIRNVSGSFNWTPLTKMQAYGGTYGVDILWVRLWSYERTAAQTAADHAKLLGPTYGDYPGLYGHYRFQDSLANSGALGGTLAFGFGSGGYKNAEAAWASPDLDDYERTHALLWTPDIVPQRWMRIDLDWTANPAALVKAGRLYVSRAHAFARNPALGSDVWTFEDAAIHTSLPGGQRIITPSAPVPGMRLPFEFTNAADMNEHFYEIARARGASHDVLVCTDPTNRTGRRHQWIGYGTMQSTIAANVPAVGLYQSEITLRGLI